MTRGLIGAFLIASVIVTFAAPALDSTADNTRDKLGVEPGSLKAKAIRGILFGGIPTAIALMVANR